MPVTSNSVSKQMSIRVFENGKEVHYDFGADINGKWTVEQEVKIFNQIKIEVAADARDRAIRSKELPAEHVTFVGRRRGVSIKTANPLDVIEFIPPITDIGPALLDIYQRIERIMPIGAGRPGQTFKYGDGNIVVFNGKQVATTYRELLTWVNSTLPETEFKGGRNIIRFINVLPYARRMERKGITGHRPPKVQYKKSRFLSNKTTTVKVARENGTYALVARQSKRAYKALGIVKFDWISGGAIGLTAGAIVPGNGSQKFRSTFKYGAGAGRPYVYPSIEITVNTNTGILQ